MLSLSQQTAIWCSCSLSEGHFHVSLWALHRHVRTVQLLSLQQEPNSVYSKWRQMTTWCCSRSESNLKRSRGDSRVPFFLIFYFSLTLFHSCDWQRPKKQENIWLHYVSLYIYFVLLSASAKEGIVLHTCPKFLEQWLRRKFWKITL